MIEYKDVMLAVAGVAATFTGFGLVFLAIVTALYLASRLSSRGFLILSLPALAITLAGAVAVSAAISWLVGYAGTQGRPDLSYAIALWTLIGATAGAVLTAILVVFAHWGYIAELRANQ